MIENPAQLPGVVDIAIRTALARRGVAHLTFRNDVQVADTDEEPYQHVAPARPPATAPIYLPPPGRARCSGIPSTAPGAGCAAGCGMRGGGHSYWPGGCEPRGTNGLRSTPSALRELRASDAGHADTGRGRAGGPLTGEWDFRGIDAGEGLPDIDTSVPHSARIYDYILGGHFL